MRCRTRCPTRPTRSSRGTTRARARALARLYEKAKGSQWNANTDLDWSIDVDEEKVALEMVAGDPNVEYLRSLPKGSDNPMSSWGDAQWTELTNEFTRWRLSQFLHGEQGALVCTAKIVESVPWIDAKYYAATQVMDEARHVEVFGRYLTEKLSGEYPINAHLRALLDDIINDTRWDMTYLGMQIMVEGLALAAFGFMNIITTEPLLKRLLRYVMSDEARHVAFGVLSLQEVYSQLTAAELRERQEFAYEAAVRMRDRFLAQEVWERVGRRRPPGHPARAREPAARGRPVPPAPVLEDRPELQEARPARRGRRLAARPLRRHEGHPVRGRHGHRRGVRGARRGGQGPAGRRRLTAARSRLPLPRGETRRWSGNRREEPVMASIRREITTAAAPAAVWDAVRDVGGLHTRLVPGFVVETELDADGGARVVSLPTAWSPAR